MVMQQRLTGVWLQLANGSQQTCLITDGDQHQRRTETSELGGSNPMLGRAVILNDNKS